MSRKCPLLQQRTWSKPSITSSARNLFGTDFSGLDHGLPAGEFVGEECLELLAVVGDHIEADSLELGFGVRRLSGGCQLGFELRPDRCGQSLGGGSGLP